MNDKEIQLKCLHEYDDKDLEPMEGNGSQRN